MCIKVVLRLCQPRIDAVYSSAMKLLFHDMKKNAAGKTRDEAEFLTVYNAY